MRPTTATESKTTEEQLHQPLMSQSSDPFYVAKEEIENGLKISNAKMSGSGRVELVMLFLDSKKNCIA